MSRFVVPFLLCAAVTPAAAQGPIDFSKVQATRDSFTILVQGIPRGFEVMSVERGADGILVRDETNLMPVMKQTTEVRFTTEGALRTTKQTGTAQGKPMSIDVRYLNGKATGTASTPGRSGEIETKPVNADVPATAIDDNTVLPLLVGAPWGPSAKFSIPVFASGMNRLHDLSVSVTGTEKITVPLGAFDAYKAELSGMTTPLTVWVSATAPHRVLKVVPAGVPFEFVAAK